MFAVVVVATALSCQQSPQGASPPNDGDETQQNNQPAQNAEMGGEVELLPFEPPAPKMRRLTRVEYENTIHDLFGDFVEVPDLEPDTPVNGFSSIGASQLTTSRLGVEKYETAAFDVAKQVLRNPARLNLIDCTPQSFVDGPCATSFLEDVGQRILRRPLTPVESQRYQRVALLAMRDLEDFWLGLEFGLAAMLQSPNFLYRTSWGDPDAGTDERRLTGYEIATRLSYFIWASTPDDTLLQAAADGRLDTEDGIREEVDRMLRNPRSVRGLRTLWDEFLQLRPLETKVKDPQLYPEFGPELAADMREETLRVVEAAMHDDVDFRTIFSTNKTFVNGRLAALYDLDISPANDEWVEVEMPESSLRRGILGHASFLTANAHAATTSPTHRGLFVRQSLLCLPIPPPPPNIDLTIEPAGEGETHRDKIAAHMENDGCSGCHKLMDPIGFGFEHFDALGQYRDKDNNVPVDSSGDLDGEAFENAGELAGLIAEHESLGGCMVRKVYRHALGHVEGDTEEVLMRDIEAAWESGGYRFRDLLNSIVTSDGFLFVKGGE